ncbi:hypothetical protein KIPB_008644 [Kipferlia bialata]|uniref:Uncharacterized protein n=1 Tax=Kipferlia bialata TaxID=797122 RepID=A0A391NNP5_9EUKA|nr:hypothetical protein KIPB_008644 [Kipferlia bialata]|eukprot:g8644.t1
MLQDATDSLKGAELIHKELLYAPSPKTHQPSTSTRKSPSTGSKRDYTPNTQPKQLPPSLAVSLPPSVYSETDALPPPRPFKPRNHNRKTHKPHKPHKTREPTIVEPTIVEPTAMESTSDVLPTRISVRGM